MISDNDLDELLLDLLRTTGKLCLPAHGFSMRRHEKWADTLILHPVDIDRLRIGNVLVYRRGGLWIAHRVIWKYPKADARLCVTKGDAFPEFDSPAVMKGEEVAVVAAVSTGQRIEDLLSPRVRLREWYRGVVGLFMASLWAIGHARTPGTKDDSGKARSQPPPA